MSVLEKFGVPLFDGTKCGILKPQEAYRFRMCPSDLTKDEQKFIMREIEKCDFDIKNKTFTITLRQPVLAEFLIYIQKLVNLRYHSWTLEFLDGASEATSGIQYNNCDLETATFKVDYAESGFIKHILVYKYASFDVLERKIDNNTYQPIKLDKEFVTPEEAMEKINEKGKDIN